MIIIGVDYHPSMQQIAWVDAETGECGERRLTHSDGQAEEFYRKLKKEGVSVRVGMEATGHARWFERLLAELDYEVWVGDPAQIRAKQVRKQKNDRRDAEHLLKLMLENNFPRIWVPTPENRDVRQLVWHRHRLVGMRGRVMNQLQAIAMNEGVRRKRGLWSEKGRAQLESLQLPPWTTRRRQELLELLDRFDPSIDQLNQAIEQKLRGCRRCNGYKPIPVLGRSRRWPSCWSLALRIGSTAASRWPAIWGSFPARTRVRIAGVWVTSASKATRCSVFC